MRRNSKWVLNSYQDRIGYRCFERTPSNNEGVVNPIELEGSNAFDLDSSTKWTVWIRQKVFNWKNRNCTSSNFRFVNVNHTSYFGRRWRRTLRSSYYIFIEIDSNFNAYHMSYFKKYFCKRRKQTLILFYYIFIIHFPIIFFLSWYNPVLKFLRLIYLWINLAIYI